MQRYIYLFFRMLREKCAAGRKVSADDRHAEQEHPDRDRQYSEPSGRHGRGGETAKRIAGLFFFCSGTDKDPLTNEQITP